jgi:5-formyltetrahydrofolate cyclo-ligase
MNKEAARKYYITKRNELSSEYIQKESKIIAEKFIASGLWKKCTVMHIFISIPGKAEIDTSFLMDFFFTQHPEIKICTSVVDANGKDLLHTCITPATTYRPNKWNIPEPVERTVVNEKDIDLVLLPLLAFDIKGNRVGYGKGFYDRFLQNCKSDVVKVGLSLFEPTEELIESDVWDVPLDWGVTPECIYDF